jgi:glyoxylase-like metal-dependent hydrolase (beta-lactamase superfamily II)
MGLEGRSGPGPMEGRVKIGDVEIFVLCDGVARVDGGGMFGLVPKVMWEKKHPADDLNRVEMKMHCLLIRDGEHNIVVDTGYGSKLNSRVREILGILETGQLPEQLKEHGLDLSQIDLVINTHLHGDHCGGNTVLSGDHIVPTFPSATYIVQGREWDAAMNPNERTRATYLPENFLPVRESGRLELIEGDTQIAPHVRCVLTTGHDASHQSVLIESKGEKALYLADLAPFAIHIERLPWVPAYDLDPMGTIDTRRRIQKWAVEEHVLLIFDHDPEIDTGYLHNDSGRYRVEPIG